MIKFKDVIKKVIKVVIIILMVLLVVFLSLLIHHNVTKKNAAEYLPVDAQAYIEIDSLKELYDDIIDLKALEIVLSQDNLNDLFYSLIDFKNADFSDSILFKELLKLKAYIVLQENYSPGLIIDPGLKGILTRHIPIVLSRIKNEDFKLTTSLLEGETLFTITIQEESSYHLIIEENLLLVSLNPDDLKSMLIAKRSGGGLKTKRKLKSLKSSKLKKSILNIFLDTDSALKGIAERDTPIDKLLKMVKFPTLTTLSLALTNDNINLRATTDINSTNTQLNDFLGYKASPLGIIKNLPDTTNIYASVNFKSFKDFYSIITLLQDELVLKEYDILLKALSGLKSDDILFSWTGSEAGLFTIDTAPEPVIYLEIDKIDELERILETIDSSLILNLSDSLIIDGVRVNQFKLSTLLELGVNIVNRATTLPYFIIDGNYIYLSQNPETLAHIQNKKREGELLIKDKTYRSITQKTPKNANFFFYYDLNSTLPRFLIKNNVLTNLIKEYEKGVISLFYTKNQLRLNLSAETAKSKRTTLFPGYPKKTKGVISPILISDIVGKESKELIYIDSKNSLIISDISNKILSTTSVGDNPQVTLLGNRELLINDSDGIFYRVNGSGEILEPTPKFTETKNSFSPVRVGDNVLLYSTAQKELQLYTSRGDLTKSIKVNKDVFSKPLLLNDTLYFYPKSLFGTVFATDLDGNIKDGWPQQTLAISFSSPFKVGNRVGFITQKGDYFLWDRDGNIASSYPINLEGVFYSTPVSLNSRGSLVATINKSGTIQLINGRGEVVQTREIKNLKGRDVKLKVETVPGFKSPILFVYGGSNYIYALNNKLQVLPGFPIKGNTEPTFSDINSDGFIEIISGGYDKNIYIYTMRNN